MFNNLLSDHPDHSSSEEDNLTESLSSRVDSQLEDKLRSLNMNMFNSELSSDAEEDESDYLLESQDQLVSLSESLNTDDNSVQFMPSEMNFSINEYQRARDQFLKETETDFLRVVRNKRKELDDDNFAEFMKKTTGLKVDPNLSDIQEVAKQYREKLTKIKELELYKQHGRGRLDYEELRANNEFLKKKLNDAEVANKLLKVEIRKLQAMISSDKKQPINNHQKSISAQSTDISKEKLLRENDKIKDEMRLLKKVFTEREEEFNREKIRLNKLNTALFEERLPHLLPHKGKEKIEGQTDTAEEEEEKKKKSLLDKLAAERSRTKKQNEDIEVMKEKIIELNKEYSILKSLYEEKSVVKLTDEIKKLQRKLKKAERLLKTTTEKLALDNQIKCLFPKYFLLLEKIMNVLIRMEGDEKHIFKRIVNFIKEKFSKVSEVLGNSLEYIFKYVTFKCFGKINENPDFKKYLAAGGQPIESNPLVLKLVKAQTEEIKSLKQLLKEKRKAYKELLEKFGFMKGNYASIQVALESNVEKIIDEIRKPKNSGISKMETVPNLNASTADNTQSIECLKSYVLAMEKIDDYNKLETDNMVKKLMKEAKEKGVIKGSTGSSTSTHKKKGKPVSEKNPEQKSNKNEPPPKEQLKKPEERPKSGKPLAKEENVEKAPVPSHKQRPASKDRTSASKQGEREKDAGVNKGPIASKEINHKGTKEDKSDQVKSKPPWVRK